MKRGYDILCICKIKLVIKRDRRDQIWVRGRGIIQRDDSKDGQIE